MKTIEKETLLIIRPAKIKEGAGVVKRGPLLMEQAFAALHSIRKHTVSLEIGNLDEKIAFFARAPKNIAPIVEGQIYAQYPDIDVAEISPDALDPEEGEEAHTVELMLTRPPMFPIKRHPQFDDVLNKVSSDPLSAITSTLTRFPSSGMRGHIAVTFRPVPKRFRKRMAQFIPLVIKGLSRKFPWYRQFFTKAHLSRGWQRVLLFPFDILMGGFRSLLINTEEIVHAKSIDATDSNDPKLAGRSHDREDAAQGAKDKMQRLLFDATIRITVIAKKGTGESAMDKLREIAGSFQQFSLPNSNSFREGNMQISPSLPRGIGKNSLMILSNEELATLWHLPTILVKTPNVDWVMSRNLEPPHELPIAEERSFDTPRGSGATQDDTLTILGASVFRGQRVTFGIKQDDRRRHLYAIGKTGMGKSTLLENMIFSDIHAGKGLAVIDPHGDLADAVLRMIPKERTNDVVLFDPTDMDYPVSFNMLECPVPEQRPLIASGLMAVFTKIWPDVWSGRMEHILRNTLLALLECQGNSMLGILRMYADDAFCKKIVEHLTDPLVRSFWEDEYFNWSNQFRTEAVAAIQNKIGQLLTTPILRNIVGQSTSKLDIRHAMDTGKILIANLSKGKLGEDNSSFIGSMLVTKFQIDAMSRADVPEAERRDFYLYVDEFQNFATASFATILSEARKYRLNLTMANQFIGQLSPDKSNTMLKDAVFGNVGTLVSFQVGSEDAEVIASQFGDESLEEDILGLPKYQAYMRLMINGLTSRAFSVATLPPPDFKQDEGRVQKIRALSRERYALKRSIVEEKISKWAASAKAAKDVQKKGEKQKEKEVEEIKKAKKKGMKLDEYRKWRDREMWTNSFNALKKKQTMGETLNSEELAEMEDLRKKIEASGGPTVPPAETNKHQTE